MRGKAPTRVLFVCMGNICRSPTAAGMFRKIVDEEGLGAAVEIESAGTLSYHAGERPDARASAAAHKRGIDLSGQRARHVLDDDFERFDHILAMDRDNLSELLARCPPQHQRKIQLFLALADDLDTDEVPDPYYGGAAGFERVLDLVETASRAFAQQLLRS